jgi:2-polyprenyl-3-methyl-5-hydroxy-6-metoxy-1,4-benzoquinol methylase
MANYGKADYWEDRYQKDKEQFDWLQRFCPPSGNTTLKDLIGQYCQPANQILVVGCGTSRLSEELFDEGYLNVTSIDSSYTAIKLMTEEYKEKCP